MWNGGGIHGGKGGGPLGDGLLVGGGMCRG